MGLITLILLLAFTLLYLDTSVEKKPEFLVNLLRIIHNNREKLTLWGAVYALIGILLTPAMAYSGGDVLIRVIANLMVMIMALPFVFDKYADLIQAKTGEVLARELRKSIAWIQKQEKYVGYAAGVMSILLFAVVFK